MNKLDLIKNIAAKTGLKRRDVENIYETLVETISHSLASGEKVQLIGFGTFKTRKRSARPGRNPRTGKPLQIQAKNVPAFKPGKMLKQRM